jgi:hypothetical protein
MLENPKINIKLKLSALWTSLIAFFIYGDYFELYVPGTVEGLFNGTAKLDSPGLLLAAAISIILPASMIALSVLLRPKANRILNIVFASLLTLIVALVGATSISTWHSFYVLYAIIEIVVTVSIIWIAWNWPKTPHNG